MHTPMARRGMVSTPHHLASQSALAVLREGGNAIEAAVAAAATLSVVLPQVGGLGGDGFWLIAEPGKPPVSIDGSGASGGKVDPGLYRDERVDAVPATGPLAAATVAGLVSSWNLALDVSAHWGGGMALDRLFEDAITYAKGGFAVTRAQAQATAARLAALKKVPGFAAHFLVKGKQAPAAGHVQTAPALAGTLERLAAVGLDDFYRGDVARMLAEDLKAAGSPLRSDDLARHRGMRRRPLSLSLPAGTVFNAAPPTQGLAALILLGVAQRLELPEADATRWAHLLAEATKQALRVREVHVTDPHRMSVHATTYLSDPLLDRMATEVDRTRAADWLFPERSGEAAWIGVIDGQGRAVSCVQGLHQPFGSGVVLPATGILWHDRAAEFSLDPGHRNALEPRRKPLSALAPALARLKDGRTLVWGSSGGDAQPQLQAQLFARAILGGSDLQAAVSAPRFTVAGTRLAVEGGLLETEALAALGHRIDAVEAIGNAGALLRRTDGMIEGASDPRGDGSVAGW
ncbi:MAG: gamma-glutamyltransferase family protein [Solirubrobacterales bacterium]